MMSNETVIASLKEKIDDLNQQAWEARISDSPKAFELSNESVKLSREINYSKGLAEGLRSLGFCYVRLFKNDEAEPLLRESLSLFQSLNDLRGQAVIYEYLGIIERNWGNLGRSLELLLKGNELIRQVGPVEIETTTAYQIGVTYKHLGNHENALDYLYRSLALAEKIDLTLMVAYSTNIIGSIYFDNGNYEKALELYQQGLVIRRQSNDKWGEAGSLDNIGITYLKLNQLDKAIDHCKQSLAISQSTGDKKGEANALLHLAEIYQQANDIQQASKFSNESLAIRQARGDKRGEAEVLLFLADLHKNKNDADNPQIFEWLSGALNIANEIKAQDILSKAFFNLHEYHQGKGDYKKSLAQLESYLHIEKELHKNAINQKVSNLEISHKAEAISQQNKELTELNKQIEKANAELKVESSLERVRTAAMAMKEPSDMLEICKIISKELASLEVKEIRNVQTAIFYEEKGSYMNYEYYAKHNKTVLTETSYTNHEIHQAFADQMMKGYGEFYSTHISKAELPGWISYQKTTNVFIDQYLETASSLNYYWFSLGHVALGISTYFPLRNEDINLFKRFRNVFELAYRRYLDIEKALAQARESQIQLALERVRARTMAMQHSNELQDAAILLFEQIKTLGIPTGSCAFNIWSNDEASATVWSSSVEGKLQDPFLLPHTESPIYKDVYTSAKNADIVLIKEVGGTELKKHFDYLTTIPGINHVINKLRESGYEFPEKIIYHFAFFTHGYLSFHLHEFYPEAKEIFVRFAKVFDQTYTRFLDLQKAEAQAREAQIEAALERVRSRSMGMQKSNELKDVIQLVYEQFVQLKINVEHTGFIIDYKERDDLHIWLADQHLVPSEVTIPCFDSTPNNSIKEAKEKGKDFFEYVLVFEEKNKFYRDLFKLIPDVPDETLDYYLTCPGLAGSGVLLDNIGLYIENFSGTPYTEEENNTLMRFGKVFQQTYTRFLDLQKAEAQAREAQIEAALEKVRSRSMAMQKSEELKEVIRLVYEQFVQLKINVEHTGFIIDYKERDDLHIWQADQRLVPSEVIIPYFDSPFNNNIKEAKEKGQDFFKYLLGFEEKNKFYRGLFKLIPNVPEESMEYYFNCPGVAISCVLLENVGLHIENFSGIPYTDEENKILMRFGKVFQQTYTRFLDLQKAEAQARESQIQLALERARAQSMMMQHSTELDDTLRVFHEQVLQLGIPSAFSFLWLPDEEKERHIFWAAWAENNSTVFKSKAINYPLDRNEPATAQCLVDWKSNQPVVSYHVPPGGVENYFAAWSELIAGVEQLKPGYFSDGLYYVEAFIKYGCFGVMVKNALTEDEKKILNRFAIEFERTYTRFLDLQKAEAQAREGEIQLALERVRAKSLAMHQTIELQEVIHTVHKELLNLNLSIIGGSFVVINDDITDELLCWGSGGTANTSEEIHVPHFNLPFCLNIVEGIKKGPGFFTEEFSQEEKKEYFTKLFKEKPWSDLSSEQKNETLSSSGGYTRSIAVSRYTSIFIINHHGRIFTETENDILKRFAKVFEQAYTRFLDLQKAEAQAREAQIEAALEKIRSRSLAMHKSEELKSVMAVVFEKLKELGLIFHASGIYLFTENSKDSVLWVASPDVITEALLINLPYEKDKLENNEVFKFLWKSRQEGNDIFNKTYPFDEKNKYFTYVIKKNPQIPSAIAESMLKAPNYAHTVVTEKNSSLMADSWSGQTLSIEEFNLLKRVAKVFEQAYTRFLDLQKAEAQTREALIEGALERVRARALAMQQPEELKDVAQVLRTEMGSLGIEELETCSIYIHEQDSETAECWYALKDPKDAGKTMVADHFHLDLSDTWVGREMKKFYSSDEKQTSIVMQGANRKEWINYCYKHSPVFSGFYGESIPDRTYHLYKFSHGYIGAAAPGYISNESWKLLSRAASVFSLAYSRFRDLTQAKNDLIKLKEEKQRAESALTELQATQKQLIQTEKMASLGELTAGIAHEIQNPLNFVNNFSDVSNELIDEMKEELQSGNTEQAVQIINDVKENLEKILHHGKRADAIVKGMLQHSRSSSGVKELTDINNLADEYLRLAFHGYRAKDKSFNAKFETNFDNSIEKINVIPQDIGRVILNLINNAFYTVNEKRKQVSNGYEPTVIVSTKKIDDKIEISVKDNGNGIPQKMLDKIFQPFFTTKPTGQGTGLGLSLSYDIITKGHAGEIEVKTEDGKGAEFIVSLPVN